jgi:hypothetical protein
MLEGQLQVAEYVYYVPEFLFSIQDKVVKIKNPEKLVHLDLSIVFSSTILVF